MGRENHYSLLSNCVYIQIKYNKMCKANLENEQVTHESQADCLPLVCQMKQNSWRILSEKSGESPVSLSPSFSPQVLRQLSTVSWQHDLLILGTLQLENSSSSYHGSILFAALWPASGLIWSLPTCSLLALNPHLEYIVGFSSVWISIVPSGLELDPSH